MATRSRPLWMNKQPFTRSKSQNWTQQTPSFSNDFDSFWPKKELCNCQGKIHKVSGNCLCCGKVSCELETRDSAKCTYCASPFSTGGGGASMRLVDGISGTKYSEAIAQCNKLMSSDRSDATTRIFDDNQDTELEQSEIFLEIPISDRKHTPRRWSQSKV